MPDWKEEAPESFAALMEAPFLKNAESMEDAITAITNAADHMGNSIRIPSEHAGEADLKAFTDKILEKAPSLMYKPGEDTMAEFLQSIGVPTDKDGYKYEPPEGKEIPEDLSGFAEIAHKHGLTTGQFNGLLGDILQSQWDGMEADTHAQGEEMKKLQTEWGAAFEGNMAMVKNFLRLTDAPEGLVDLLADKAMSPAEIKWVHGIATAMKDEAELAKLKDVTPEAKMTPVEAAAKIQEIMDNREHPYWNAANPLHKKAVEDMLDLQRLANPD